MKRAQNEFLMIHVGCAALFIVAAFLLENSGYFVDFVGASCGAMYSLLTTVFYAEMVSYMANSKRRPFFLAVMFVIKVVLLFWFVLSVPKLSSSWIFSAIAGFLCIVPGALVVSVFNLREAD